MAGAKHPAADKDEVVKLTLHRHFPCSFDVQTSAARFYGVKLTPVKRRAEPAGLLLALPGVLDAIPALNPPNGHPAK